jgi:hypothetical protein
MPHADAEANRHTPDEAEHKTSDRIRRPDGCQHVKSRVMQVARSSLSKSSNIITNPAPPVNRRIFRFAEGFAGMESAI